MDYKKVDLSNWARKEHYHYYTEQLKIEFNITATVNVTNLVDFCHKKSYRFYAVMIYLVTKVLNKIENFRMFQDEHGNLCIWEQLTPNYTIFHKDDKTFSDCWTEYSDDFTVFYTAITADMETYRNVKGIKAKAEQPANFYCITCVPWIHFLGCSSRVNNGEPQYFPIIAMGKYEMQMNELKLPVNLTIAHAVCDGYHAALFFEYLQKEINLFCGTE